MNTRNVAVFFDNSGCVASIKEYNARPHRMGLLIELEVVPELLDTISRVIVYRVGAHAEEIDVAEMKRRWIGTEDRRRLVKESESEYIGAGRHGETISDSGEIVRW